MPNPALPAGYIGVVLAASYLMWRYIETPCRKWIRGLAERKLAPAEVLVAD
jgi:peptidoglycan/LPS O-acetylase OafA/YrhL